MTKRKYIIYYYDVDHEGDIPYSYYMFGAEPNLKGVKKALRSHGFPDEIVGANDTKIYEVGSELDGSMIVDIEGENNGRKNS